MNSEQQYIDLFTSCREMICNHSAAPMNAVRDEAFENFCRLGFPSKKQEEYRYTDMQALFAPDYGLNLNRLAIPVDPYEAFRCDVPNLSTLLYFVVNDQPLLTASHTPHNTNGVVIDSLKDYCLKNPDFIGRYYSKIADFTADGVTALNTVLAQDGLLVYVPRGVIADKTVQVVNILRSDVDLMVNRRVLIVVEEGAAVKLLFCDHASDDRPFLATEVVEAFVGRNASLELYSLEETHYKNTRVSNVYISQQADSRVVHNVITLHNGMTLCRSPISTSMQSKTEILLPSAAGIIRPHIAQVASCINTCSMINRRVLLPVRCSCVKMRRRPFRKR